MCYLCGSLIWHINMYILYTTPFFKIFMSLVQRGNVIKFGWIAFYAQRIDNVQQIFFYFHFFFTKLEHCSLYETLPRLCMLRFVWKCNFRVQYGIPLAKHFTVLFLFNMNKSFNIFYYSPYLFIYSLFRCRKWRGKWKTIFVYFILFFLEGKFFVTNCFLRRIDLFKKKSIYHSHKHTSNLPCMLSK